MKEYNEIYNTISHSIYRAVLDYVCFGIQIYTPDGYLRYINKYSETISGVIKHEVLNKYILDIYHLDASKSTVCSCISKKSPIYDQYDMFSVYNGVMTKVLNTTYPVFDESNKLAAVVLFEYNEDTIIEFNKTISILKEVLQKKKRQNSQSADIHYCFKDIIGTDPVLMEAVRMSKFAAKSDSNIFIIGETGTGKELFAQSIYSYRKSEYKSFTAVNCSTIPESLSDSIIFGSTKGAYTGSMESEGIIAEAENGVLFLDEVNSLPLAVQAKLLRVVEEQKYSKLGSNKALSCNVRIISACNENPWKMIENKTFRRDLFFRLSQHIIELPNLKDRADILLLANYFAEISARKNNTIFTEIDPAAKMLIEQYPWPGNIRELKHAIEFACEFGKSPVLSLKHFPGYLRSHTTMEVFPAAEINKDDERFIISGDSKSLKQVMNEYESYLIKKCLRENNNNITKTAAQLKISRQALQHKIKLYQLNKGF